MRTYSPKKDDFEETWYLVDAEGQVLGRLATRIASILRGKHLPTFAPHMSPRTHVVVINAEKVKLTGRKLARKIYYRHTGWVGGLRAATAQNIMDKKPEDLIRFAVRGMIPKNRLGRATMKRLLVYAGPEHPHKAQNPRILKLQTRKVKEAQ